MAIDTYDIQELVNQSGVPRRTIYFYVQQGILPPPEGAGLAAHYGEDHLLRLQLIPLLRQQGLRLDEIRARFAQMNVAEMRGLLQTSHPSPAPAPRSVHEPAPPEWIGPPARWGEQRYTHYTLPAGITLTVPDNLSAADRQRLQQLLQAARQIFPGAPFFSQANSPASSPAARPASAKKDPDNNNGGAQPPEEE